MARANETHVRLLIYQGDSHPSGNAIAHSYFINLSIHRVRDSPVLVTLYYVLGATRTLEQAVYTLVFQYIIVGGSSRRSS